MEAWQGYLAVPVRRCCEAALPRRQSTGDWYRTDRTLSVLQFAVAAGATVRIAEKSEVRRDFAHRFAVNVLRATGRRTS